MIHWCIDASFHREVEINVWDFQWRVQVIRKLRSALVDWRKTNIQWQLLSWFGHVDKRRNEKRFNWWKLLWKVFRHAKVSIQYLLPELVGKSKFLAPNFSVGWEQKLLHNWMAEQLLELTFAVTTTAETILVWWEHKLSKVVEIIRWSCDRIRFLCLWRWCLLLLRLILFDSEFFLLHDRLQQFIVGRIFEREFSWRFLHCDIFRSNHCWNKRNFKQWVSKLLICGVIYCFRWWNWIPKDEREDGFPCLTVLFIELLLNWLKKDLIIWRQLCYCFLLLTINCEPFNLSWNHSTAARKQHNPEKKYHNPGAIVTLILSFKVFIRTLFTSKTKFKHRQSLCVSFFSVENTKLPF